MTHSTTEDFLTFFSCDQVNTSTIFQVLVAAATNVDQDSLSEGMHNKKSHSSKKTYIYSLMKKMTLRIQRNETQILAHLFTISQTIIADCYGNVRWE